MLQNANKTTRVREELCRFQQEDVFHEPEVRTGSNEFALVGLWSTQSTVSSVDTSPCSRRWFRCGSSCPRRSWRCGRRGLQPERRRQERRDSPQRPECAPLSPSPTRSTPRPSSPGHPSSATAAQPSPFDPPQVCRVHSSEVLSLSLSLERE